MFFQIGIAAQRGLGDASCNRRQDGIVHKKFDMWTQLNWDVTSWREVGGGSHEQENPATRNRTRDHLIAAILYSQMLYQLSYSR